ncbi:MAG: helix-turn-helix domain-containing protein [Actinomycetota bacterium]|nr:helix-turn-helix domain-containing protein [Actinomycetota bacterium]
MPRTNALSSAVQVKPASADRESAALVARAVQDDSTPVALRLPDGTAVPLPRALVEVLRASADELAEGHAVTVLPSDVALTPAEVAELLGVSRPFVVRLLDAGDIPSERLPRSRHRRVLLSDAVAFQARRERRRAGRQALAEVVEDAGLPY